MENTIVHFWKSLVTIECGDGSWKTFDERVIISLNIIVILKGFLVFPPRCEAFGNQPVLSALPIPSYFPVVKMMVSSMWAICMCMFSAE